MDWLLPPTASSSAQISDALDALLSSSSLDDLHKVLAQWQDVLCDEMTLITLCLTSAKERVGDNWQDAYDLQQMIVMLEYLRRHGRAAMIHELMAQLEDPPVADQPDRDDEAVSIPLERQIELLTLAIDSISQDYNAAAWAQLHYERADALMDRGQHQRVIDDFTVFLDTFTYENKPDEWINARAKRGSIYREHPTGSRSQNLALALDDLNACLRYAIRDDNPKGWALLHMLRGIVFIDDYTPGNHNENIQQALLDFSAALEVFTREETPYEWAITHMNRGSAYRVASYKDQAENIELAITEFNTTLEVLTCDNHPEEWADTYMNRGLAYTERMYSDRANNIERAIADHQLALTVVVRETYPLKYALIHLNLGFAYSERIRGTRAANLKQAIIHLDTALEILTPQTQPREWALAYSNRGMAYMEYPLGERSENLEQAIRDCDTALTIFTRETMPLDWARTGLNRTLAYAQRMLDYHKENLDYAINDYNGILEVFSKEHTPRFWALAHMNRGIAYLSRSMEVEEENLELAIADFDAALSVFNSEALFHDWVLGHINRGLAYSRRIKGVPAENQEKAIANYNAILSVLQQEQMPYFWAMTHKNRAAVYMDRVYGTAEENYQQVLADCQTAEQVVTDETDPRGYRDLQLMQARIYEHLQCWPEVCATLHKAITVSQTLLEAATGEERSREIIGEHQQSAVHLRYAQALLRCEPPNLAAAVCTLEEGRAKNLRIALDLDIVNPGEIQDTAARNRATTFIEARDTWRKAQQLMTDTEFINLTPQERYVEQGSRRPQLNTAHGAFVKARDAIRRFDDANFLASQSSLTTILRAIPTPRSALVYLAAGEESGLALIVMRLQDTTSKVGHIFLPKFIRMAIVKLLMGAEELPAVKLMQTLGGPQEVPFLSGGLWLAQLAQSFEFLTMWGDDIHMAMKSLPVDSAYLKAAQELLSSKTAHPEQQMLLERPFSLLTIEERLALGAIFSNRVINIELKRSLPILGELGMNDVTQVLMTNGIQDVTLIPYGYLSFFPLPAVHVDLPDSKGKAHFSDLFTVTLAPSARAKEMALMRISARVEPARPLILTVGNPQPLPQGIGSLPFAQAEADTVRRIATAYQCPPESVRYLRQKEATREQVIAALEKSWYAHLAIHGQHDPSSPRSSRIVLAGNETLHPEQRNIYLSEALDGIINLNGLRLLVLSACETALIDVMYAPDESLGLAAGFLQAGAAGVIASLWAVDDRATYLLMSRFAQFYLNPQLHYSPAQALTEAQRWLREEATNRVLLTYNPIKEILDDSPSTLQSPTKERQGLVLSTFRSLRYSHKSGLDELHLQSAFAQELDTLPYADPIYWAGFIITGC